MNFNRTLTSLTSAAIIALAAGGCTMQDDDQQTLAAESEHASGTASEDQLSLMLSATVAAELADAGKIWLVSFEVQDDGEIDEIRIPLEGEIDPVDGSWTAPLDEPLQADQLHHILVDDAEGGAERTVYSFATTFEIPEGFGETTLLEGKGDGLMMTAIPMVIMTELKMAPEKPKLADPGNMRLASSMPNNWQRGLSRDTEVIRVRFSGEQLDCSATNLKNGALSLTSGVPGVRNQNMNHAIEQRRERFGYLGTATCDAQNNEVVFLTPGKLFGDGWYTLRFTARSTVGSGLPVTLRFRTESPGLRLRMRQVQNHKSGCGDMWPWGKCDMYLMVGVSTLNGETAKMKFPDPTGNSKWEEINKNSKKPLGLATVFASPTPVEEGIMLSVLAYDSDGDTPQKLLKGLGDTLVALGPLSPNALVAGGVAHALAAAIPTNKDDLMGAWEHAFVRNQNRWDSTLRYSPSQDDARFGKKYTFDNGSVSVWVTSQEFPASWQNPYVVL